ncbi:hypothetical protein B6658_010105 (plasmid) [Campylobacter coli]
MIDLRQDDAWQSKMLNFFDEKTNFDKLNGEFGELQTKNFIQRYEVQFHQPNTTNCLMKKQRKLRGVNKC